jgi:hypothetical protein
MKDQLSTSWSVIAESWPDPVQLRHADRDTMPAFPYKKSYLRNLCTGANPDPFLAQHVFRCGKHPQIRKAALIEWLERRTQR